MIMRVKIPYKSTICLLKITKNKKPPKNRFRTHDFRSKAYALTNSLRP